MDQIKKEKWIAEVKTIRAYFFFYLAFHFKDVPMPLTTLSIEEANTIMQTSQNDVYKQIENDLESAIQVLDIKHSDADYGRHTKGSARVLLSRVYMAQNKWGETASILKDVIDSGQYELDRRNGDQSYENYSNRVVNRVGDDILQTRNKRSLYHLLLPIPVS